MRQGKIQPQTVTRRGDQRPLDEASGAISFSRSLSGGTSTGKTLIQLKRPSRNLSALISSIKFRLLQHAGARSSYVVLPIFALADAGVNLSPDVLNGHGSLMIAIIAGLAIGKPIGFVAASAFALACGLAIKPAEYSWRQLVGAGMLAGIGFTMSLDLTRSPSQQGFSFQGSG